MSEFEEDELLNPFPATAVAQLPLDGDDFVSIETDATVEAQRVITSYLNDVEAGTKKDAGQVVAIVGEYGTGKTHIAHQMLSEVRVRETSRTSTFYLDAPADTFLALYKDRFFPLLRKEEVRDRVEDYYADIIAKDLEKSEMTSEAAVALRDRTVSAHETIEKFGLMQSKYQKQLNKQLDKVTEHSDFSTAFSLMLRPEFFDAAWEWFRGEVPDPSLVDRGIDRTLDSDASVLEAIGVFAFLFGRQNWRFILAIDEMEKVLSPGRSSRNDATVLALKKLMEAIGKTNSMLLLVGLPDFLEALPEDATQRISSTIRPSNLKAQDVEKFILESKKRSRLRKSLKPFTKDVVDYLAEIAGGNARKVVRLCFHLYGRATKAETNISKAMVRTIAREQFEVSTAEDVNREITRTIDLNGWLYERERKLGEKKTAVSVDYWIPVGDKGDACAIQAQNSILDSTASKKIINAKKRIEAENPAANRLYLLVVNGHLAENLRETLEKNFDKVLVNASRSFADDLDAVLKGLIRRLEEKSDKETLTRIHDRIEQMSRRMESMQRELMSELRLVASASRTAQIMESSLVSAFRSLGQNSAMPVLQNIEAEQVFGRYILDIDRFRMSINEYRLEVETREWINFVERIKLMIVDFKRSVHSWELHYHQDPTHAGNGRSGVGSVCADFDRRIRDFLETESELFGRRLDFDSDRSAISFRRELKRIVDELRDLGRNVYHAY